MSPVIPLHRLKPGQRAQVLELSSEDPARLDRLGSLGLVPGSWVTLQQMHPALVLRVGETEISVDKDVAEQILVRTPR